MKQNLLFMAIFTTMIIATGVTTNAYAQNSEHANPDNTTQVNIWEYFFIVDGPNGEQRFVGAGFSNQECREDREVMIGDGVHEINGVNYPIISSTDCEMRKSPTGDPTEEYCFDYALNTAPNDIQQNCDFSTKKQCQDTHDRFIAQQEDEIAQISECYKNR